MNKIFNWTFGSIFRTLGRIIAYIIIAIIAVMIFNHGGFKKPKISNILNDIFFMHVDALSLDGYNDGEIQIANGQHLIYLDAEYPDDSWNITDFNSNEEDYLIIPLNGFEAYNNNIYMANDTDENIQDIWKTYIKVYIFTSDNSGNNACEFQNNLIVCPLKHYKTYTRLETHFIDNDPGGSSSNYFDIRLNFHNYGILYRKDSTIQINENYANTQDIINAINGLNSQQEAETNRTIENQNQNTQSIISNQESLTNQTIQNQNQNTQATIDSQKVCKLIDKDSIKTDNGYLNSSGGIVEYNTWGITDYINVLGSELKVLYTTNNGYYCEYNTNKSLISCTQNNSLQQNQNLTFNSQTNYVRFSISKNVNRPQINICTNGNQAMANTITDSNVSEANSSAGGFFNNFSTTDNGGLSSIITAPLSAIQSLTSASCSPLVLPLPFVNEDLTLPCMRTIYESNFGGFMTLYDVITLGIISYWILVRIFNLVKDFKNPDHDEIEVVDL